MCNATKPLIYAKPLSAKIVFLRIVACYPKRTCKERKRKISKPRCEKNKFWILMFSIHIWTKRTHAWRRAIFFRSTFVFFRSQKAQCAKRSTFFWVLIFLAVCVRRMEQKLQAQCAKRGKKFSGSSIFAVCICRINEARIFFLHFPAEDQRTAARKEKNKKEKKK